jgi:tetratricopeptide (TPR) repeat protein
VNWRRSLVVSAVLVMPCVAWVAFRALPHHEPSESARADGQRTRQFWALYRRAGDARVRGHVDEAQALYQEALALRPDHEDSLYYVGSCYVERRQYADAVRTYQKLVSLNPGGSSRGYMQLASIRASFDPDAPVDLDEAARLFQRALDLDPDSGALLGLGEVALLRGRLPEAERLLAAVESDNAMSVAAPYLSGYIAFERRDRTSAWNLFRTAVSRGELKKPSVKWTEEGDIKASPELRWHALARQSVFGSHWIRLRAYLPPQGASISDMQREYDGLHDAVARRRRMPLASPLPSADPRDPVALSRKLR